MKEIESLDTIFQHVKNPISGERFFSDKNIYDLKSLEFNNGKKILSLNNKAFIYDLICFFLNDNDFEKSINEIKKILIEYENIKEDYEIIFNSNIFMEAKINYYNELESSRNNVQVEEGLFQCINPQCKSRKTLSVGVQKRSADEPMTYENQCTVCRTKWST